MLKRANWLLCILFLSVSLSSAQSVTDGSPYSRFGLGEFKSQTFIRNRGMAGTGVALQEFNGFNLSNPASLASLKLVDFEFGISGEQLWLSDASQENLRKSDINLAYFSVAFPVNKWWSSAVGIFPYSNVNYKVRSPLEQLPVPNYSNYEGNGGINRVFFTNGFSIGKRVSVGLDASFFYGSLNEQRQLIIADSSSYNTQVLRSIKYADVFFSGGVQYRHPLKDKGNFKRGLIFGLSGDISNNLNATGTLQASRFIFNSSGIPRGIDTLVNTELAKQSVDLPFNLAFGVNYEIQNKLNLTFDVHFQDWSRYRSLLGGDSFANSLTYLLGVEYIPDYFTPIINRSNYWKTVRYQAGLRYNQSFLAFDGKQLNEFGITFGAGLPLKRIPRRTPSYLNTAIEFGTFGTTQNNLVSQKYLKFHVGFNLNDVWFIKRKYD